MAMGCSLLRERHLLLVGGLLLNLLLVGVRSLLLAEANNHVQEALVVEEAVLRTAGGLLVLGLLLHLGSVSRTLPARDREP
eukprot:EC832439.1.p2 GENE.EC832439.1~~EC832439.1.p2  ORF type:complete len:81 (-),score=9.13 EC832439.1:24-266(-)